MEEKEKGVKEVVLPAPVEQEVEEVQIDYKAELEKAVEEKNNYKKGMLDAKEILKGKGIVTDPEEIAKMVDARVEEKMNAFTTNFSKSVVESTLDSLANSEEEKKLIQYHYENSIVKSGLDPQSVRNDLENSKLLANKKAFFKESAEMKIALANKSGMGNMGSGSNQELPPTPETTLTVEQLASLKARGWDDKKIEQFKKNLNKSKDR